MEHLVIGLVIFPKRHNPDDDDVSIAGVIPAELFGGVIEGAQKEPKKEHASSGTAVTDEAAGPPIAGRPLWVRHLRLLPRPNLPHNAGRWDLFEGPEPFCSLA